MRFLLSFVLLGMLSVPAGADILLTVAEAVRSEVGSTTTASYDSIRTLSITVDPQNEILNARFELFVSSDAAKPALSGSYDLDAASGVGTIRIERLGIETGVTLTAGQIIAV